MKPVRGRLRVAVLGVEDGKVWLQPTICDEEGVPLMRFPAALVEVGGGADLEPLWFVFANGVNLNNLDIAFAIDPDTVESKAALR